jgi:hypothetical protein
MSVVGAKKARLVRLQDTYPPCGPIWYLSLGSSNGQLAARTIAIAILRSSPAKPASKYNKCGHYSTHQTRDGSFGSKPFFEPLLVSPAQNLFGNCLLSDSYFRSSKLDQFLIAVLLKITQDCCSVMLLRLRRARCEPLDHSPDRGDLRRVFCQVIVASISPPVPASLWIEYARGNLREQNHQPISVCPACKA